MREFKTYHPIVNFIYFTFVIGFSCFFMHPVSLAISLTAGFTYSVMLKGRKAVKTNLINMFLLLLLTAFINPLFNHEGVTVIFYLPNGNPITLESVIYGICASAMIVSVIFHFSCCNEIMTSDKLIYLLGKIIPSLSLVVSMTLRFVPNFTAGLKNISNAQKCIGRDMSGENIIQRAKNGLNILSIMVTSALENSVETADSMTSRGYGLPGRTAFSIYTFDKRDKKAIAVILILGIYTLAGSIMGGMYFSFFPAVETVRVSVFSISVFAAYFVLCAYPIVIEIREVRKWNVLRSKI